ncbi:hypothetical protein [Streptomyces sp. NPDC048419]|uniref:hypothetical protein n=1 Tax=Streptomyces sp. NPDC048419 TaxID=3365547 RepID=UPI0037101074
MATSPPPDKSPETTSTTASQTAPETTSTTAPQTTTPPGTESGEEKKIPAPLLVDEGAESDEETESAREPGDQAGLLERLQGIVGQLQEAQAVEREERIRRMAEEIYRYLDTRKWRRKSLARVFTGKSKALEAALRESAEHGPAERVEALRRTYVKAVETQLALFNPEGSREPSLTGLVPSVAARIKLFTHLIDVLGELRPTHLGRTGTLGAKIAGDILAYKGIVASLEELRAGAVTLSTKVPVVPDQEEFYNWCARDGVSVAAALGESLTLFVKEANKVFDRYRELAAVGTKTGTALVKIMSDLVKEAAKDYAQGLERAGEEARAKEQSLFEQAQVKLLTLDTADKVVTIGLGIGASYAGAFAPAFGAAGAGKAGVKRWLQMKGTERAYDTFVEEARKKEQSLLGAMQGDSAGTIGKGTIARMEANFDLALGLLAFVPGAFIPAWELISGTLKGVFTAYKTQLEKSLESGTPEDPTSVGTKLAEKLRGITWNTLPPGITAGGKEGAGTLLTSTTTDRAKLSGGLLAPIAAAVVEQLAGVILKMFPQDPKNWLSANDIAGIVDRAAMIPSEVLESSSITIPTPGLSGHIEEKKSALRSDGTGTAFEEIRFGNGKRWAFKELGQGEPMVGGTRFATALVTCNVGGRLVNFEGTVEIRHEGVTASEASMQLTRVLAGAETGEIWKDNVVSEAGFRSGDTMHNGSWYRPFGSTYVFMGGTEVRIVDPTALVQSSGGSTRQPITAILGTQLTGVLPLQALGLDTTHGTQGTDFFPFG